MMTNEERKQKICETGERRVEVVRAVVSAHTDKNAAQLGEHLAEDAESTWVDHLPPKSSKGRHEILKAWQELWKAFPDLTARMGPILVSENHAVALAMMTGRGSSPFAGKPATGRDIAVPAAFSLYFADWEKGDHRIRQEDFFADQSTLEGQLEGRASVRKPGATAAVGPASHHVSSDADVERVNLAVVNAMNTGLKIRELDAPLSHYAEDAVLRHMAEPADSVGKPAIRKALQQRFAASPNAMLVRSYAWCAGQWVVAEYSWEGTNEARGHRELHLFKMATEQIREQWIFGRATSSAAAAAR